MAEAAAASGVTQAAGAGGDDHARRVARARAALLRGAAASAGQAPPLALAKSASNLFRDRVALPRQRLDLGEFTHVLAVDTAAGTIDVEGLAEYEAIADAALAHGVMPAVVPQLKSITAGGAVAGVGIEATSFRHGLVHDTLVEADVLLADGRVVTCRPDNAHRDLFLALPNSYGTLGYATRLRLRTIPVQPFVQARHLRFADAAAFLAELDRLWRLPPDQGGPDFLEGVAFGPRDFVVVAARFAAALPPGVAAPSDYTGQQVYHASLRDRAEDVLTVRDWLWRWDTDWFWCSRRFGAQRPWVRRLLGRRFLNSRTYTRLMRLDAALGLTRRLAALRGGPQRESVIQDVDLPLAQAGAFLDFLLREVRILPAWLCPIRAPDPALPFTLYPLAPGTGSVNFGFWDTPAVEPGHGPHHVNRLVERKVLELGGIKSLYSEVFLDRDTFARAYGLDRYEAVKQRYDPQRRLLGLYEKCVLRG